MADFSSIRFQPNRPLLRELSADRLNSILSEIRRNRPRGERGITVRQDGNGTYIGLAAALPRGGAASQAVHPFQLTQTAGEDPELIYVRVRYGTVNGQMPTGMSAGDDPPYLLELTAASGVVYLGATLDETTFEINSMWIDQAATIPAETTDFETYVELGSYTVADGVVTLAQSATSSLAFIKAGFINLWGQA